MSSLPVVGSVPAHLHLMATTHIQNQYSPRTRYLCPSVPDLHTSPPASSQLILLARNIRTIRFYLQAGVTLRVHSVSPSLTLPPWCNPPYPQLCCWDIVVNTFGVV